VPPHRARPPGNLELDVRVGLARVEEAHAYAALGRTPSWPDAPPGTSQVAPGDPDRSLVVLRMRARGGAARMPPLATEVVDDAGLAAVSAWIAALPRP
jgi:hypothetical protein